MLKPFKETRIPVASNASPCCVMCLKGRKVAPVLVSISALRPVLFFSSSNPALRCSPLLPLPLLLHLGDVTEVYTSRYREVSSSQYHLEGLPRSRSPLPPHPAPHFRALYKTSSVFTKAGTVVGAAMPSKRSATQANAGRCRRCCCR